MVVEFRIGGRYQRQFIVGRHGATPVFPGIYFVEGSLNDGFEFVIQSLISGFFQVTRGGILIPYTFPQEGEYDVRVWLTAAEGDAVREADEMRYLDAGPLRANRGDLTYVLPAGTDPADYAGVVIWCRRFSVAFGAADLAVVERTATPQS